MTPTTELAPSRAAAPPEVVRALRELDGRATVGDVVAATGLARDTVESDLRALLETRQGHLEVSDSGELIYRFEPRLLRRDHVPALQRLGRAVRAFLSQAFKVWIVLMLVVYLVVFVALLLAALAAMLSRGDDQRGGGRGRGRGLPHGHFPMGNLWFLYWIWSPRWRIGRPYYGRRWERTLDREDRVPFYKKVFAFVFGPDRPEPTQAQLDRSVLRLIRARKGAISTAELMQHTALERPEAEEEMGRLLGAYAGEPAVSTSGELVYVFPEVMTSAHGGVRATEPNPAWQRLEYPLELTGNEKKTDALIAGIGGFNLVAGATAPLFIFPQLGIGGTAAWIGLVVVPVVFSLLFLSVPLLRWAGVRRENRARERRNVRRLLLGLVYGESLSRGDPIALADAVTHVQARIGNAPVEPALVQRELERLAAEFDADVAPRPDGTVAYRFPAVLDEFKAAEAVRRQLRLEERRPGDIVYSTADDASQAAERELAAFDRELGRADVERYLPSPDRVGFEDDFEVIAFEEELARTRAARTGRRG